MLNKRDGRQPYGSAVARRADSRRGPSCCGGFTDSDELTVRLLAMCLWNELGRLRGLIPTPITRTEAGGSRVVDLNSICSAELELLAWRLKC